MKTKLMAQGSLLILLFLCANTGIAEIVFVVNVKNPVTTLSVDQIKNLYLGKAKAFADGSPVEPIDQLKGASARDELYRNYIKKDEAAVQAYWSRLIFSGNGEPPRALENGAAVKAWVAKNPNAIGYVDASEVDGSVKRVAVK
jgi:ABC-type phosphate transport system substrate-binding protein